MENNKTKIIFICLGNICRSPLAMFLLRYRLDQLGLLDQYEVISAGLESSTAGLDMHIGSKKELDKHNIPYSIHSAHKLTLADYASSDYVIVMEQYQKIKIKRFVSNVNVNKIHNLLEYTDQKRDIQDPYCTNDFETAYNDIALGIDGFINKVILNK